MTDPPYPRDIAERLRALDTERCGRQYLQGLQLNREQLLALADVLGLAGLHRVSAERIEQRIAKQAVAARDAAAGLRPRGDDPARSRCAPDPASAHRRR
uniref:hypothetical protein n=1 Tax=Amycolatopsis sp. CA-096443 TaxID=3239919 RepID=UPI003F497FFD